MSDYFCLQQGHFGAARMSATLLVLFGCLVVQTVLLGVFDGHWDDGDGDDNDMMLAAAAA